MKRQRIVRVPKDYYHRVHEARYRNIFGAGARFRQDYMQPHVADAWDRFRSTVEKLPGALGIEFGSGTGINTITVCQQGLQMVGMDISPTAVRESVKLAEEVSCPVRFFVGDMFASALRSESFDLVLNIWTLHAVGEQHLRDKHLLECYRVMKPGGYLFLHNEGSEEDSLDPGEELVIETVEEWNIPEYTTKYDLQDGGQVEVTIPGHMPPGLTGRRSVSEHRLELEHAGFQVLECYGDVMQPYPSVPGNPVTIAFALKEGAG